MLLRVAVLLVALTGCPSSGNECSVPEPAPGGADGTRNGTDGPVSAQLVVATASGSLVEVEDGATIPLIEAPQGGHILLVGAKVMSDEPCGIDATAALRDTTTNRVLGLDERDLYVHESGGWLVPGADLASMPNVAVCPTEAVTGRVDGHTYQLELTLKRDDVELATLTASVIPTCAPNDDYCAQDCGPQTN